MTHRCTVCNKTPDETKFTRTDSARVRLRSICNLCRSARDRAKASGVQLKPAVRDYGNAWLNLGADCRPDWGKA